MSLFMASVDNRRSLTILHTNDFHNRLSLSALDSLGAVFDAAAEPKLLLDAGDAGGSTNITYRAGGEPILDVMSGLGYSAMAVGNRDFHVTRTGFHAKLSRARFPVLSANIRPSNIRRDVEADEERPLAASVSAAAEPVLRSHVLLTVGDWRVLIVGLTVPMVTPRMWERKLSSYVFDPPVEVAQRLVPALRSQLQPDLIVALTHIGLRIDRELATAVPDIDLIVGGHSHDVLEHGLLVDGCLIVQVGSHGRYLGVVTVNSPDGPDCRLRISATIKPL